MANYGLKLYGQFTSLGLAGSNVYRVPFIHTMMNFAIPTTQNINKLDLSKAALLKTPAEDWRGVSRLDVEFERQNVYYIGEGFLGQFIGVGRTICYAKEGTYTGQLHTYIPAFPPNTGFLGDVLSWGSNPATENTSYTQGEFTRSYIQGVRLPFGTQNSVGVFIANASALEKNFPIPVVNPDYGLRLFDENGVMRYTSEYATFMLSNRIDVNYYATLSNNNGYYYDGSGRLKFTSLPAGWENWTNSEFDAIDPPNSPVEVNAFGIKKAIPNYDSSKKYYVQISRSGLNYLVNYYTDILGPATLPSNMDAYIGIANGYVYLGFITQRNKNGNTWLDYTLRGFSLMGTLLIGTI